MKGKGSLLLVEKPFAYVLKSKLRNERCDYCFARVDLLKCSNCQYVQYCNRDCQKGAWPDHKDECTSMKKIAPRLVPDAARLLARIVLKLRRGGDREKGYYMSSRFRIFKDLMSHYTDLKADKLRMEHFTSLCAVLRDYIGEESLPHSVQLMTIYGKMCVNGFNILDPEMLSIGTGIYLAASILDHSCDPNAVAVFQGTTIHIRALCDFPNFDWSKVFITYIDLLNAPADRQTELQATYYFLCECRRCRDIEELGLMSAMLCPNAQCAEPISDLKIKNNNENTDNKTNLTCSVCNEKVSPDHLNEFHEITNFLRIQIESMKDIACILTLFGPGGWSQPDIDVCEISLKKQEGLLHPLNLQRVKLLDLAFESAIEMSRWHDAKQYGLLLLPGYKRYFGEFHPLYGIHHLKLGKIHLYLECLQEAVGLLKEAERILRVTHGTEHVLYRQELMPLFRQAHTVQTSQLIKC